MGSSRVMCPHCDGWFFPEEGVSLDDCPVCGRTVEVKPAPAPLPILVEATLKGIGHDYPGAECTLRAHISDLTRRLDEAEHFSSYAVQAVMDFAHVEREDYPDGMTLEQMSEAMRTHLDEVERQAERRAEAAEARVRELEVDNREVTREMLCIKAERDALRERCEGLEWLVEVQEFYMYRLRNPGGWSTPGMERAKIGEAWQHRSAANGELRAMYLDALAATEVK